MTRKIVLLLPWIAVAAPGLVADVGYVAIAAEPGEKPAEAAISSAGDQQRQTEADDNDGLGEAKDRWSVERLQLRLSIEDQTTTIKQGWDGYAAFEDNCQPQELSLLTGASFLFSSVWTRRSELWVDYELR